MDVDDDEEDELDDGEGDGIGLDEDYGDGQLQQSMDDDLQANMNIGGEDSQIDLDNLTESQLMALQQEEDQQ